MSGAASEFPGGQNSAAGFPPYGYRVPAPNSPSAPDAPIPWLAALLGLIPGVGAIYNGQFAKGLAHLAIFAVLVSLSGNVNGIFGLFVTGWVFYQAFEAFHTARARRDGLPLPNAFGLNDIGERLGFGKNWPGAAARPVTAQEPLSSNWQRTTYTPPVPQGANVYPDATLPPEPGPYATGYATAPNWAGYVPPTAFPSAPPTPVPGVPYQTSTPVEPGSGATPGWNSVPYTSHTAPNPFPGVPLASMPSAPAARRFPVGAVILIGLGGVFLLSNIAPRWHLNDQWLLPLLLLASAVWVFVRRVRLSSDTGFIVRPSFSGGNGSLVCALRLPVLLLALAIMFALQAAGSLTIGQTWPLLLIVLGALLLLERTVGRLSPTVVSDADSASGTAQAGNIPGSRL